MVYVEWRMEENRAMGRMQGNTLRWRGEEAQLV